MKIKLTQEQSDNLVTKMLVQDYKRMVKRNDMDEDGHLIKAFEEWLGGYYLTVEECTKLDEELSK